LVTASVNGGRNVLILRHTRINPSLHDCCPGLLVILHVSYFDLKK